MQIIAGTSNSDLATRIAAKLGLKCIVAKVTKFSDGEFKVQVSGIIDKEVIIVHSTVSPVNDNLIELLLLTDLLQRAGAQKIIAIIPYFGYARQDRQDRQDRQEVQIQDHLNSSLGASTAIKLIESLGINEVITLDLHSKKSRDYFNIPIYNLKAIDVFLAVIKEQNNFNKENIVIVSPDHGGIIRAREYAQKLKIDLAIINKVRDINNICFINDLDGSVTGKHCIIIDDIVSEANTLCHAVEFLLSKGAISVEAFVTHGVFCANAIAKIKDSPLSHLYITDSIPHYGLPDKITVLAIDELLASTVFNKIKL